MHSFDKHLSMVYGVSFAHLSICYLGGEGEGKENLSSTSYVLLVIAGEGNAEEPGSGVDGCAEINHGTVHGMF